MTNSINIKSLNHSAKKQQGIALLMSLIMLLLITVIGLSSVKLSMDDTKLAGNSMFEKIVFQGAESGLNQTLSNSDLFNVLIPASNRLTINEITNLPDENVQGFGRIATEGSIRYERILESPKINSVANSSEFNYQLFRVSADSQLQGTSAKDIHTEGRALQIPKG